MTRPLYIFCLLVMVALAALPGGVCGVVCGYLAGMRKLIHDDAPMAVGFPLGACAAAYAVFRSRKIYRFHRTTQLLGMIAVAVACVMFARDAFNEYEPTTMGPALDLMFKRIIATAIFVSGACLAGSGTIGRIVAGRPESREN